ncbi:MAG: DUF3179 domain-containing protein [Gammaproteobacteria bacterium]|nr:DUF3179 domain-containing protein [Gammaproteobacteria bacterium]
MARQYLLLIALISAVTVCLANNTDKHKATYQYAIDLYGTFEERTIAREWIKKRNKPDIVPALIRTLRYFPEDSAYTLPLLKQLTGQELGKRWFNWVVWLEANPVDSYENNELFLSHIFSRIDPQFEVFFYSDIERKIRLNEIIWGGVRKDGIPALTKPTLVWPQEASYLKEKDLVFGISINGDTRAYPYRIMDWHEMFNDVIGGIPVSLAYCTLCGSGILYKTQLETDKPAIIFGSSGFLYRSNKLMYDQKTHTLWNQFSGKPVVGPLTNNDIELEVLPVVTTTWGKWLAKHPNTKVLSSNTGFKRDYSPGVAYGAYFGSDDLMFPAHLRNDSLQKKEQVFGLRISGAKKAWPLKLFATPKAINDKIGIIPIVIIGDASTQTVRAYRSKGKKFILSNDGKLLEDDIQWHLSETELIGPNNESLARLPGHIAYWFAWSGYFPDTLSKN